MHVLAVALLSAALLQNPSPPTATTGAADTVTTSSATVTGTVNPGGAATTYHFEYGTSSSYGLTTPDQDLPAGTDPVGVRVALQRLTADTTYHYRLVATNAAGVDRGGDRTLHTAPNPRAPTVSSLSAQAVGALGATLRAYVTPNRLATTVRFEYGTTTGYGSSTPEQGIGAGASRMTVTAPIGGLRPNTRYHFRAVATNAAGVTRGGDRAFTTARAPTGVTVSLSTTRPLWGTGLTVTGRVSGQGRIPVALERLDFPFTGGFYQVGANVTTDANGKFSFPAVVLFSTTRVRVTTRTAIVATSPVATASVAVKVGLRARRVGRRRASLTGATWPAVPNGRISLQRLTRTGRWLLVARARPRPLSGNRSRYRFTVRRARRAIIYRVVVLARDGGAHVPGMSSLRAVPARR